jgi:signal transduction histidine kinase/DNA-binding response OmpR family regulator
MNNIFPSLVSRIYIAMFAVVLLSMSAIIYYWVFVVAPTLKANEQSEVELLISPYTEILEAALDNNDKQALENVLNRLSLLKDHLSNEPIVVRISVNLIDGTVIERRNNSPSAVEPFRAETPLFSPSTMDLLGSVTLEYSDAYYQRLMIDVRSEIAWILVVAIVLLLFLQIWVRKLLQPLNELSNTLGVADLDKDVQIPATNYKMTSEIGQVWRAIQQLFVRLQQRDIDVAEEHKMAQLALEEKLEAEAASYEKSKFLTNMSHELRTPLNAIIGYSEMLYDDAVKKKDSTQKEDLSRIQTAGRHLLSLINDILDLSRIELGKTKLYLEDANLPELIDEVVDTIQPLVTTNNNNLVVSCDAGLGSIHIDVSKFRQTLINILGNAAKFTRNGIISLKVNREMAPGTGVETGWIVVRIKDTGIGISKEQQEKLFRAFTQADESTTRVFGGSGLGLAISQNICRLMGGDITVNSQLDEGSEFCVRIPSHVTNDEAAGSVDTINVNINKRSSESMRIKSGFSEANERRSKTSKILVIDDDTSVVDLLERTLGLDGYQVESITQGSGSLNVAHKIMPDLILLDILIPDVSGWSILAQLKKDPAVAHIPVVMHSALDERSTAFALGASGYLFKPADHDKLSEVILRNLRRQEGVKILIIDDDIDTRRPMRMVFENEGWNVIEEVDGDLGLIRVLENYPSAIILDLNMPRMNGEEFLVQLDTKKEYRDIPVLALTGKNLSDNEKKELMKNVDLLVEKGPHSIDSLLARLRVLINGESIKTAV